MFALSRFLSSLRTAFDSFWHCKGTKFIFGFASSCKLLQIVAIFSAIFFVFLDYFHSYAIYMTSRVARSRPQRCSWSTHNWASRSEPNYQKIRESYFSVRAICHTDKWLLLLQILCIVQLCIWSFKFFKIVWIYFYYILYNIYYIIYNKLIFEQFCGYFNFAFAQLHKCTSCLSKRSFPVGGWLLLGLLI